MESSSQQNLPRTKEKEDIGAARREYKHQAGSLIKHQASQRNLSPFLGKN